MWVRSLGWDDPLEKEMATHSRILAWEIPCTEEPGQLYSMESRGVRHNWVNTPPPPPRPLQGPASLATQLYLVLSLVSHPLWLLAHPASHTLMPLLFCELVRTPPPVWKVIPQIPVGFLLNLLHEASPDPCFPSAISPGPAFLTPPPCSDSSFSPSPSNMVYNLSIMFVAYLPLSTGMYTLWVQEFLSALFPSYILATGIMLAPREGSINIYWMNKCKFISEKY